MRSPTQDSPNLEGVRKTTLGTVRDASRVSDVVARVRARFAIQLTPTLKIDLNDAAREVLARAIDELLGCRVSVWLVFANNLPNIPADRAQLQKVILDMLRNAVAATKDVSDHERRLIVTTEAEEGRVRLSVQAHGRGVASTVSFAIPMVASP